MTSPLMANAQPDCSIGGAAERRHFARVEPAAGQHPDAQPGIDLRRAGQRLLYNQLIADGMATDTASAQAYVATQTPAQIADYLRARTPAALLTTLLTKLAALGWRARGRSPTAPCAGRPDRRDRAGNYIKVPVLAGNTRDEAKLFPTFLALSRRLGGAAAGWSATRRCSRQFSYNPSRAHGRRRAVDPGRVPARDDAGHRLQRADRPAQPGLLHGQPRQRLERAEDAAEQVWYYRFDWDEEPAPWNDIYGAAHAFDLPFIFGNFGPSLFANIVIARPTSPAGWSCPTR